MKSKFLKVWSIPIVLGILTIVGLMVALVGAGMLHFVAWILLSVPIIVILKYLVKIRARN